MARVLALLVLLIALSSAPSARADGWRWPVRGPVARAFHVGGNPFARGGHRGIDIVAPAGSAVRAACDGPVRFAGIVGASGRVVSVACGALTATYLHLGSLAVRAGARVRAGDRVGTVGPADSREPVRGPHLHFGVRRTTQRFGYLDPLALLPPPGRPARPPVLAPPAKARRPALLPPVAGPPPAPGRAPVRPRAIPAPHPPLTHPSPGASPALHAPRGHSSPARSPVLHPPPGHSSRAPSPALPPPRGHPSPAASFVVRLGLLLAGLALPTWGGALVAGRRRRRARAAPTCVPQQRAA